MVSLPINPDPPTGSQLAARRSLLFLSAALILALAACNTRKAAFSFPVPEGTWHVVELNGRRLAPAPAGPHLSLDPTHRKLSAYAGCNQIAGEMETNPNHNIRFHRMITTRKACLDMQPENELLEALNEVVRFRADDPEAMSVAFYDANHRKRFVLKKSFEAKQTTQ
jgi:heat shock protein HslJ